jgi:NhaP-type Na+/H+ or K+/H+ antiporter
MPADPSGAFLEYHEPDIVSILTVISFFILLTVSAWLSNKIFRAGLIGQIVVGLIYGVPIANILPVEWQETFLALGYIGLILIIFEGMGAWRDLDSTVILRLPFLVPLS